MSDNPRIEELRRRVQKDPASIAFAQLAEEYRRSGEYDEAVRVCRTGLAKHPSYLSARVTLGRALIELQQYDDAHTELDYVLRSAPENLAAIRGLAEIHQRRGDLAEALKQYQNALNIAKHDPELEESVQELTRQLGGAVDGRPEARTYEKAEVRAAEQAGAVPPPIPVVATGARPAEATVPPPIPVVFGSESAPPMALPAEAPSYALETFEPPTDDTVTPLSPELEAAADEFTRALEALDAITIDVSGPALPADTFALPAIPISGDDRLVPAHDWEHGEFSAPVAEFPDPVDERAAGDPTIPEPGAAAGAPNPDADAVADLQNWLDNIVLDKEAKQR